MRMETNKDMPELDGACKDMEIELHGASKERSVLSDGDLREVSVLGHAQPGTLRLLRYMRRELLLYKFGQPIKPLLLRGMHRALPGEARQAHSRAPHPYCPDVARES